MFRPFVSKAISQETPKIWRIAISNGHEETDVRFIGAYTEKEALDRYREDLDPNPLLPIDIRYIPDEEYNAFKKGT